MNKIINSINKTMQKGHAFLIIIIVLICVIAVGSIYIGFFTDKTLGTGQPATTVKESDGNQLVITDIYEGERSIPKYNYTVNTYDLDKFSEENGLITYPKAQLGIDVSEHQGVIDWAKVKENGVDFAIVRAGYRGYTRGRLNSDTQFENNIKGATEAGIKVGVYFFSQAVNATEAEEEASYVLGMLGDYKIDYPIVFDWEPITDSSGDETPRTDGLTGDQVSELAAVFCNKISKAGYNTAVYMNKTQGYGFYNLDTISNYDIWYAEYQKKPSFYYNFTVWQYSDSATIDGIESKCDINISFKDYTKK